MTIGTKLIQFRKIRKLSQRDVADYIGVSQTAYSEWEADKVSFQVKFLPLLAELFGIDPIKLLPNLSSEKTVPNQDKKKPGMEGVTSEHDLVYSRELITDLIKELIQLLKEENRVLTEK